jgi:high-affinity iron transporter
MMALAVVLVGKGTHSLQEAGVIPVSTLPLNVRVDLIGLYPSYQTVLMQAAVLFLFGFLFLNDRRKQNSVTSS